ncbi:MAG TPA: AMP-binding protein [Gracilimonas sp.]|nr:AMP-binding protein [Gracilimonas sp.]
MIYKSLKVSGKPKSLVKEMIKIKESCLIVPPYYKDKDPEIEEIEVTEKYIGLFSSGTTGRPKCIWNSFDNLLCNAKHTLTAFEIEAGQKLLILAAPWHVAGLSWALMAEKFGYDYVFIATKKGDEKKWHDTIQQFRPDVLLTVPSVLRGLDEFEWFVPKIIYGGTLLEPQELLFYSNRCKNIFQGYGQTEAGGLITAHKFKDLAIEIDDKHRCCGKPINGVEISCEGTRKTPGPIYVRSITAYTNDFYQTGDLGYKDENGDLFIQGRIDKPVKDK